MVSTILSDAFNWVSNEMDKVGERSQAKHDQAAFSLPPDFNADADGLPSAAYSVFALTRDVIRKTNASHDEAQARHQLPGFSLGKIVK
jgi:hypothetical protein